MSGGRPWKVSIAGMITAAAGIATVVGTVLGGAEFFLKHSGAAELSPSGPNQTLTGSVNGCNNFIANGSAIVNCNNSETNPANIVRPQQSGDPLGPGAPPAALLADPNNVQPKEKVQIYSHIFSLYGCSLVGRYIKCFLTHKDIGAGSGDVPLWDWVGSGVRFIDQSGLPHKLSRAAWLAGQNEQSTMPIIRNHALWFVLIFDIGKDDITSGTLQLKILGDNKTMEVTLDNAH